jgi:hypothetical protein
MGSGGAAHRPAPTRRGRHHRAGHIGQDFERYNDMMPLPGMTGDLDEMAPYAGQSVGLVRNSAPAREIVAQLAQEANEELAKLYRTLSSPDLESAELDG